MSKRLKGPRTVPYGSLYIQPCSALLGRISCSTCTAVRDTDFCGLPSWEPARLACRGACPSEGDCCNGWDDARCAWSGL
eukprot:scaffold1631_cov198-Pinguiococcus_pyrenoidosus.AAC.1